MNYKTIVSILAILILSSCVSKKKYIEMQSSRDRAQNRVRELTVKVNKMEADYTTFRNEFHYNNSLKDEFIDSLSAEVDALQSMINAKEENIENKVSESQIEKKRLTQLLVERDKEIGVLKTKVGVLEKQVEQLKQQVSDISFESTKKENAVNDLKIKLDQKDTEIRSFKRVVNEKEQRIASLTNKVSEQEKQIEKLRNNVKLLKSQIGQ